MMKTTSTCNQGKGGLKRLGALTSLTALFVTSIQVSAADLNQIHNRRHLNNRHNNRSSRSMLCCNNESVAAVPA